MRPRLCGFVRSRLLILAASTCVGAFGGSDDPLADGKPGTGGMPSGKQVGILPAPKSQRAADMGADRVP
eukprot:2736312-Pleurochrysis_carterae.AAC.1